MNKNNMDMNSLRVAVGKLDAAQDARMLACTEVSGTSIFDSSIEMGCLDYGHSFVRNTAPFNAVRMWIESRTIIIDGNTGKRTIYYQGGSCKAENTFDKSDLFKSDNYDFLPVFGENTRLIFRRHVDARPEYKTVTDASKMWGDAELILSIPSVVTLLDSGEKIWMATKAGLPLVTQTEITDSKTGLRAMIECPVKTMNVRERDKAYQVDTGPVCLPDLSKHYDPQIACLRLAYIALNAPDFADFVVETETSLIHDGKEVARVNHYSERVSFPAVNRVLALGKL